MQGLTDALCHAAVDLAGQQQGIDGGAEVVDHRIAHNCDQAGLRIDLDLGDVAAVRICEAPGQIGRCLREAEIGRSIGPLGAIGGARHIDEVERAIGAHDSEMPVGKLDIAFGSLQHMGRDALSLGQYLVSGRQHCVAADRK